MNEPDLEFVWVGDDAVDPLEQAQTLEILVGAGIKTREEARADLGLAPAGGGPPVAKRDTTRALLGKYNPHHDERGQFATADVASGPVGKPTRKPRPTGVQVAQIIEPEPSPPPPEPETPRPEESTPAIRTEIFLRRSGEREVSRRRHERGRSAHHVCLGRPSLSGSKLHSPANSRSGLCSHCD